MTYLEILNTAASVVSISSTIVAVVLFVRQRISEARERANIEQLKGRLTSVANGLTATAGYLQTLIRQADNNDTPVRELQNMARGVRAGLLSALTEAQATELAMSRWKVGQLLKSGYGEARRSAPSDE